MDKFSNKNYPNSDKNKEIREKVDVFWNKLQFQKEWIIYGANVDMVKYADEVGKYLAPLYNKEKECLSKSQIRNVYGEIKRIQFKGIETIEGKTSFMLLKPKIAYAEGRNKTMGLSLFKKVFDLAWGITSENLTHKTYENFCALLEAILAYHKAYGGQD